MLVKFFFFFLVWSGPICFTVNPTVHLTNPALSSGTKPHSLAPWGHRPGLFLTASPLFYFFLIEFFWKIPNQVKAKAPWRPLIILFFYFILTRDMYFGVSQNRINRGKKVSLLCCFAATLLFLTTHTNHNTGNLNKTVRQWFVSVPSWSSSCV